MQSRILRILQQRQQQQQQQQPQLSGLRLINCKVVSAPEQTYQLFSFIAARSRLLLDAVATTARGAKNSAGDKRNYRSPAEKCMCARI